jgi:nicotinate-nucleotide adenylyltransferase
MIVANYMAEFTDLEEVWFMVSPHNPLKPAGSLLQDYYRLHLVNLAIGDYKKIKSSKVEFSLPKPSYTINTLTHLKQQYPQHEFVLIMGSDTLEFFKQWKSWELILDQYEIYIYTRPSHNGGELKDHLKVKFIDAPLIDISATFIRNAIQNKKDMRFMLPEAVFNYIEEMKFYQK